LHFSSTPELLPYPALQGYTRGNLACLSLAVPIAAIRLANSATAANQGWNNLSDDALCSLSFAPRLVRLRRWLLSYVGPSCHYHLIMGALLSVPVLGYLLMPSLGTYSTSLNLLFFYMTWSTLVLSQPPLKVEIIGTLAVRLVFFVVPSSFFLLFDTLLPSLAVGMKTQGPPALPTRIGGVIGARRDGRPQWYQVTGLSLFNICLALAIQAGIEILFTDVFRIRSALRVTTTLPMPWSIVKEMLRALLLREVSFSWCDEDFFFALTTRLQQRSCNTIFIVISTVPLRPNICTIFIVPIFIRLGHPGPLARITTILSYISFGDSSRFIFRQLHFECIYSPTSFY